MRFFYALCLSVLVAFSVGATPTYALTLSPAVIELAADPGTTVSSALRLVNDEASDRTYFFSIQKFIPNGENGQQDFLPPSDTSGLPSWLYLERSSVTIKPRESRIVPFEIRVPNTAAAGGYYVAIFVSDQSPTASEGQGIAVVARTGALMLLRVNGPVVEKASVQRFALESKDKLSHLPAPFSVLIQNDGNVHFTPVGTVTIRNMFGRVVSRLPVNPEEGRVLPASSRNFSFAWEKQAVPEGRGFWHETKAEWNNFALGSYEATLQLESPVTGPSISGVRFSVWPWHLGVALILLLMCLFAFIRWYRTWVIRSATVPKK